MHESALQDKVNQKHIQGSGCCHMAVPVGYCPHYLPFLSFLLPSTCWPLNPPGLETVASGWGRRLTPKERQSGWWRGKCISVGFKTCYLKIRSLGILNILSWRGWENSSGRKASLTSPHSCPLEPIIKPSCERCPSSIRKAGASLPPRKKRPGDESEHRPHWASPVAYTDLPLLSLPCPHVAPCSSALTYQHSGGTGLFGSPFPHEGSRATW